MPNRQPFRTGIASAALRLMQRAAAVALLSLLIGCNTVGSVDNRAESVNRTTASYAADAVLLNILRAEAAEPLNFVSLTGVTGHITASAGAGLPTVLIGPGRTPAQNLFPFGPNTLSGSEASDFTVNVIDDPGSYAALTRPADPATIGFFINQISNRDLLLFLLISRFDVFDRKGNLVRCDTQNPACAARQQRCDALAVKARGNIEEAAAVLAQQCPPEGEYFNEPYTFDTSAATPGYKLDPDFVTGFFAKLLSYVDAGLTVAVDPGYAPQAGKSATAVFCFDPYRPDAMPTAGGGIGNLCPSPIVKPKAPAAQPKAPPQVSASGKGTGVNISISTAAPASAGATQPNWSFDDPDPNNKGGKIYVYTRSVFGMYRYLGEILRLREAHQLGPLDYPGGIFAGSPQTEMLNLTHDLTGCWLSLSYNETHWCVPADAIGTKRTFVLLHELFELYATPSSQPATQTVRVTQ